MNRALDAAEEADEAMHDFVSAPRMVLHQILCTAFKVSTPLDRHTPDHDHFSRKQQINDTNQSTNQ